MFCVSSVFPAAGDRTRDVQGSFAIKSLMMAVISPGFSMGIR
jgi:hypothetical protein